MTIKHKAVGETQGKFMINKFLAKQYLDSSDYEKFMEIVTILKTCDQAVKEVLKFGDGRESNDS